MAFPVCDTANKTCVQCLEGMTMACGGTTPVCKNSKCTACTQHADCTRSNACLSDGSCVADDMQVAYVDSITGTDNMTCFKSAPCTRITKALATKRPYVKLKGDFDEAVTINDQNVTLLADPGATLARNQTGPILQITATGTNTAMVEIDDLQITGTSGRDNTGISVPVNGNVTLSLKRAKISGNQVVGINFSGGSLTISKSEIYSNQGGGVSIGASMTFDITNSFIYRNGSSNAMVGGVALPLLAGSTSRFEFNTVVDNQIQNSTTLSGGVTCDKAGFTAPNNIIARNLVNNDPNKMTSNTLGLCAYPTSTVSPTVTALKFSSPDTALYNYHITAGSSAINQATTPSTITVDFDNDPRPKSASDQGADQYKP
ncbi:MAG: right-handed parallel beta-helix repeat-containing protein [Deltaproteobacteria bacterium]|nr:MAG: right-handed parallel beta-helix repeat-containing protein [Deltaproteobacteria bacterium]